MPNSCRLPCPALTPACTAIPPCTPTLQPLPAELTAATKEWNRSFMQRWRAVKKRAYLQALGLRALWRVNSLSDRHEPLELLTNDLPQVGGCKLAAAGGCMDAWAGWGVRMCAEWRPVVRGRACWGVPPSAVAGDPQATLPHKCLHGCSMTWGCGAPGL